VFIVYEDKVVQTGCRYQDTTLQERHIRIVICSAQVTVSPTEAKSLIMFSFAGGFRETNRKRFPTSDKKEVFGLKDLRETVATFSRVKISYSSNCSPAGRLHRFVTADVVFRRKTSTSYPVLVWTRNWRLFSRR